MLVTPFPVEFLWSTVELRICIYQYFPSHANNSGPRPYLQNYCLYVFYESILLWLVNLTFLVCQLNFFFQFWKCFFLSIASIINFHVKICDHVTPDNFGVSYSSAIKILDLSALFKIPKDIKIKPLFLPTECIGFRNLWFTDYVCHCSNKWYTIRQVTN